MNRDSKILVTGAHGLIGGALVRELRSTGFSAVTAGTREMCDLRNEAHACDFFDGFEYVFHCAARVGGIIANQTAPVEFFRDNMLQEISVLEAAHKTGVKKLLLLGSACAYPKRAATPVREDSLLTGPLESSNELYALAKISGIKLCDAYRRECGCNFISAMPTNIYGFGDHYDLETSHVIPGMIRRFHEAEKSGTPVKLWGTGDPLRDFLFADDMARACVVLMERYDQPGPINICSGRAVTVRHVASIIAEVVGYSGVTQWDSTRPNGTPNRTMDGSRLYALGWRPTVSLRTGIGLAYMDFICQSH